MLREKLDDCEKFEQVVRGNFLFIQKLKTKDKIKSDFMKLTLKKSKNSYKRGQVVNKIYSKSIY